MSSTNYSAFIDDMTWSYSRLNSFSSCPYAWYLKYLYGDKEEPMFYASYGSFMHKLLERFYKGEIPKEQLPTEFLLGFKENVNGERANSSIVDKYISSGHSYLSSFKPLPFSVLDVEKKVNFKIGDVNMVGFIDYVGRNDNGRIVIVDHKSRELKERSKRKKPTKNDEEIDKMLTQLYIYSKAIEDEYGEKPEELCFNCFKNGILIREPFKDKAYDEAKEWVSRTHDVVRNSNDFSPILDYFYCKYLCGFHNACCYYETAFNEG